MSSFIAVSTSFTRPEPRTALDSQRSFRVTHRECRVSHVLPEFLFRHLACFAIPDVRRDLPRRKWLAVNCNSQHDEFTVPEGSAASSIFESFYAISLCGNDGHVAARIARKEFECEVD